MPRARLRNLGVKIRKPFPRPLPYTGSVRLLNMKLRALAFAAALAILPAASVSAQAVAGSTPGDPFKDTSMLKLPAGSRAAIFEFEDLECPACANAAPVVKQALDTYKIPFLRHDFLIPYHYWSKDAAVTARYLQDKVNPELAEQFRRDVFANQRLISSQDDLQQFTRKWFQAHGQQIPFVMDPNGLFIAEVNADTTLGNRLGLVHTPTLIVIAPHGWTQVTDVSQLYTTIDKALAETPARPAAKTPAHSTAHKSTTTQK